MLRWCSISSEPTGGAGGEPPHGVVPVVVVGAGPAGLAVAAELRRHGRRALLLEQGDGPGWAWSRHYDGLRLHTTRRLSSLPGLPIPAGLPRYVERDAFHAYLLDYARVHRLDVLTGTTVWELRPGADGWRLSTTQGEIAATSVVVATGANRLPSAPEIPGRRELGGTVLHSRELRHPERLAGARTLVVGLGNSGADLAAALSEAGARVTVAVRGPVHAVPLEPYGIPWRSLAAVLPMAAVAAGRRLGARAESAAWAASAQLWTRIQEAHAGDLRARGLPLMSPSQLTRAWHQGRPPLTASRTLALVRRGTVPLVPSMVGLEHGAARLADGSRVAVDAVVLATGFRHGLEEILPRGLGAALTRPVDGPLAGAPGLFLCGYLPELVRIRRSARRVAAAVVRYLGERTPAA